jgi:hypothetical protein
MTVPFDAMLEQVPEDVKAAGLARGAELIAEERESSPAPDVVFSNEVWEQQFVARRRASPRFPKAPVATPHIEPPLYRRAPLSFPTPRRMRGGRRVDPVAERRRLKGN